MQLKADEPGDGWKGKGKGKRKGECPLPLPPSAFPSSAIREKATRMPDGGNGPFGWLGGNGCIDEKEIRKIKKG
jgi:hypothetical protein